MPTSQPSPQRHPQTLEPYCGDEWPTIELEASVLREADQPVYHRPLITMLSDEAATSPRWKHLLNDAAMLAVGLGMVTLLPLLAWKVLHS